MKKVLGFCLVSVLMLTLACSKKSDDNPQASTGESSDGSSALLIENGSVTIPEGSTVSLSAVLLNKDGTKTAATNLSWTVEPSSLGSISGSGVFTAGSAGTGKITVKSGSLTVTIPVVVDTKADKGPDGRPLLSDFIVAPAAILWIVNGFNDELPLAYAYFGSGSLSSLTYVSSDENVVTVSSSGVATFKNSGFATITVSASNGSKTYTDIVPVSVIGKLSVPLSVTRVALTPSSTKVFMDASAQFTAKAYNSNNEVITGETAIWEVIDNNPDTLDNNTLEYAATIDQNGKLSGVHPGEIKVKATVKGIASYASVFIYPRGFYTIDPIMIDIAEGGIGKVTASLYKFNDSFEPVKQPFPSSAFKWVYGIPDIGSMPGFPNTSNGSVTAGDDGHADIKVELSETMTIQLAFIYNEGDKTISPGAILINVKYQTTTP